MLHITTAVREGEVSSGLLTEDTGSITRLNLTTNEGAVAVTVALLSVCTEDAEFRLADTYFGICYWLAQYKAALEGKSSLRFLLPIFNYLPPFLVSQCFNSRT